MPSIQKGEDIIRRQTFFGGPSQGALFGLAMGIQFGFQFLQATDARTIHPRGQNLGPLLLGNFLLGIWKVEAQRQIAGAICPASSIGNASVHHCTRLLVATSKDFRIALH